MPRLRIERSRGVRVGSPQPPPAILGHDALESRDCEIVDTLHRPIHMGVAQYLPPPRKAAIVCLLGPNQSPVFIVTKFSSKASTTAAGNCVPSIVS